MNLLKFSISLNPWLWSAHLQSSGCSLIWRPCPWQVLPRGQRVCLRAVGVGVACLHLVPCSYSCVCVPCPWSCFWLTGVTKGRPQHRAMSKVQLRNKSWPRCTHTQYARRVASQGLCAPQARTSHGARSSPLSVNLGQEQGFSRITTSNQHFYFSNCQLQLVESETVGVHCPLSSEQLWVKSSNAVQLTWDQQIWEDYYVILSAGYNLRTSSAHKYDVHT